MKLNTKNFEVSAQAEAFASNGGRIFACGTCMRLRKSEGSPLCQCPP